MYRMPQYELEEILGRPSIFRNLKPMADWCGPEISFPLSYTCEYIGGEDLNVVNKKENV